MHGSSSFRYIPVTMRNQGQFLSLLLFHYLLKHLVFRPICRFFSVDKYVRVVDNVQYTLYILLYIKRDLPTHTIRLNF